MHALPTRIATCTSATLRGVGHWLCVACAAGALWSHSKGLVHAAEPVLTSTAPPEPDGEEPLPMCKTDIRLSGSVYDAARPERSFALFSVKPGVAGALYRAGMWVGDYELVTIEPRGVLLRNRDGVCSLRLVGDPIARANRPAAPPPARERKAAKKKTSGAVVVGRRR